MKITVTRAKNELCPFSFVKGAYKVKSQTNVHTFLLNQLILNRGL